MINRTVAFIDLLNAGRPTSRAESMAEAVIGKVAVKSGLLLRLTAFCMNVTQLLWYVQHYKNVISGSGAKHKSPYFNNALRLSEQGERTASVQILDLWKRKRAPASAPQAHQWIISVHSCLGGKLFASLVLSLFQVAHLVSKSSWKTPTSLLSASLMLTAYSQIC